VESAAISQGTVQTPNGDTNAHQAQDGTGDEMMDEEETTTGDQDTKKRNLIFDNKKKILHSYIYLSLASKIYI